MAESLVVSGLVSKRAEVADQIIHGLKIFRVKIQCAVARPRPATCFD